MRIRRLFKSVCYLTQHINHANHKAQVTNSPYSRDIDRFQFMFLESCGVKKPKAFVRCIDSESKVKFYPVKCHSISTSDHTTGKDSHDKGSRCKS